MPASTSPDKTASSPREHVRLDEGLRDQSDEPKVNATGPAATVAEEPADAKLPMPQPPPPLSLAFAPVPTKMAELTPVPTPVVSPADTAQSQPPDVMTPASRRTTSGPTEPGGADGVRHVVQLSSERGEAVAQARSQALQTKYRDALAGHQPVIRRADLGDRGVYYRVQVGPFAIGEANQLCEILKKSGAECIVHRN